MKLRLRPVIFLMLTTFLLPPVWGQTFLPPNDTNIQFTGSFFNKVSDTAVVFGRFTEEILALPSDQLNLNPDKARTNTGITVRFRTDASSSVVHFVMDTNGINRTNLFGLYADGDSVGEVTVKPYGNNPPVIYDLTFTSPGEGEHTYMITLPPFCTMIFKGLTLSGSSTLSELTLPEQPVYIAYGNSITHGQGQQKTEQTYPWLLAQEMGWRLYNLAVGGAKTSIPVAEMIRDTIKHVDYMTVLIGYNDWMFRGLDTAQYRTVLTNFLQTAREKHPETRIFLITQTFTLTDTSKVGILIDDYRKVQRQVAASLQNSGDTLLYLIRGEEITGPEGLRDKVHFNVPGAQAFSRKLAEKIRELLTTTSVPVVRGKKYDQLDVYPNPTTGRVFIRQPADRLFPLQLYDLAGKRHSFTIKQRAYGTELDLRDLPGGLYILRTGMAMAKILKQ